MTPLRQRLIEDRPLRGLAERTQERDVRAVRPLADPSPQSPDQLPEEAQRDDVRSLPPRQPSSRRPSPMALCGIPCVDAPPRKRAWTTLTFVRPPQEHTLPVLLSLEDVHRVLQGGRFPRARACLRTLSAWGLRLQEGTPLQEPASARARMVVHGREGPGAQDRDGPLPQPTRALLRPAWHTHRPPAYKGRFFEKVTALPS